VTSKSVLVTDGGRGSSRSALATVRALGAAGYRSTVTTSFGSEFAASSKFASDVGSVPPARDFDAYRSAIRALMTSRGITTVFATSDDALIALDPIAAAFVDKNVLNTRLTEHGIGTPHTRHFATAKELLAASIDGPIVVKPVTGSAPAVRFEENSDAALLDAFEGPVVVQPFLTGAIESVSGVIWNSQLCAAVHQRYERTWPVDCGTASFATTTGPDIAREALLTSLLSEHQGIFQAQYVGGSLIDVNPRPYGSMPLALRAGVNLPAIVCELRAGDRETHEPIARAKVGVGYRWIEGDLRSLISSRRSGSVGSLHLLGALRPHRGTAHSVFAGRDLRPLALRAATIARAVWGGSSA